MVSSINTSYDTVIIITIIDNTTSNGNAPELINKLSDDRDEKEDRTRLVRTKPQRRTVVAASEAAL